MSKYANKVVEQAKAWLGRNENDGTHKTIIDVYNAHKPLARGYAVKYTDAWCATFVSAVAIKLGYTDIIPTECSCPRMIDLFKKLGCWKENENRTPAPGEIIFYDWEDNGSGDNKGSSDHVGIVEKVSGGIITVIEGNYSNSVKRRKIAVNGRYIRGYGIPAYDAEKAQEQPKKQPETASKNAQNETKSTQGVCKVNLPVLRKGDKGRSVVALQSILIIAGFNCGGYGADGDFGTGTEKSVKAYQKHYGLAVDGIVGQDTWTKLLK